MTQSESKRLTSGLSSDSQREAKLDYIHSMLGQLRVMAEMEKLDMLAYLIDMARVEVGDILRSQLPARARSRRTSVHR